MPMDIFGKDVINEDIQKNIDIRSNMKSISREIIPLNEWTKHVMTYQYGMNPKYFDVLSMAYIDNPLFEFYQRLSIKGFLISYGVCQLLLLLRF